MELPKNKKDIYPFNRANDFKENTRSTKNYTHLSSDDTLLLEGDSLEVIKSIKGSSIDLILTDPPYHSTKKKNIYGDADFDEDKDFLEWVDQYVDQFIRVLKPNGSMYLFCSSDMAPYLFVNFSKKMNMHNVIGWSKPNEPGYDGWKQKMKKTSLRRWYPHSEKIIFCSPAVDGNLKKSSLGLFLKECRRVCGLSANRLTEMVGAYNKVNNGGAVSNWETGRNIPSREQYAKISHAFISTKKVKFMPEYEDVVRAFNVDPKDCFVDIWDHMNVRQYRGKHPAEKPLDLLDLIIKTSSYEGDVVLDTFAGSGATLVSAAKNNRKSIGVEIDPKWVKYAAERITAQVKVQDKQKLVKPKDNYEDLPLFSQQ